MNQEETQEMAQLVAKEVTAELRKVLEPVLVTIVALQLQRNTRELFPKPLTLEEAITMAMTFIHQTRRQIYPYIVEDTERTRLDGYPTVSDEDSE